jgi:hypothetical protein
MRFVGIGIAAATSSAVAVVVAGAVGFTTLPPPVPAVTHAAASRRTLPRIIDMRDRYERGAVNRSGRGGRRAEAS